MNLSIVLHEFYSNESIGGDSAALHVLSTSSPLPDGNTLITVGHQERTFSPSSKYDIPNREKYKKFSVKVGTARHTSGGGQSFSKHL